ncbi:MAG: class I SAM-dependent methyltransferase [Rhizomicrobium sp.]|jgi:S-adenosylmethionine-dependent methyltransferase
MISDNLRSLKKAVRQVLSPVPVRLSKNQKQIGVTDLALVEKSIRLNYHTGWRAESTYSPDSYRSDLEDHLYKRLELDRTTNIPWLDSVCSLPGKKILEIGCGTGSSTVALAEQGAKVIGIDIDEDALRVACDRCRIYDVDAEVIALRAEDIAESFGADAFDVIVFFASLEHMTIAERLRALRSAWTALRTGGALAIVETPNRLWYFDEHTSRLPFFHWLPDELAFEYSQFSPRQNFNNLYRLRDASSEDHFLRRGRGVSFHEFDIAIDRVQNLHVVSSLSAYQGIVRRLRTSVLDRRYKAILKVVHAGVHDGFFDPNLDLVIEKR